MRFLFMILFLGIFSNSSLALDCSTPECYGAQAVVDILNNDKTPEDAKELLIAALNGKTSSVNTVILSNTVTDAALGTEYRSIKIGVDDLMDDDDGWGVIFEIEVKTVHEKIHEVTLRVIAG